LKLYDRIEKLAEAREKLIKPGKHVDEYDTALFFEKANEILTIRTQMRELVAAVVKMRDEVSERLSEVMNMENLNKILIQDEARCNEILALMEGE